MHNNNIPHKTFITNFYPNEIYLLLKNVYVYLKPFSYSYSSSPSPYHSIFNYIHRNKEIYNKNNLQNGFIFM